MPITDITPTTEPTESPALERALAALDAAGVAYTVECAGSQLSCHHDLDLAA